MARTTLTVFGHYTKLPLYSPKNAKLNTKYTDLGRELKEAQDELAKQGSKYAGVFERWYSWMGWKKRTVYNLIDRYNLVQNLHEVSAVERIEDLPVSLTYEVAKPSAESTPEKAQAKSEVLSGDIATLKEYKERIKELEGEKEQAEKANEELGKRLTEERNKKPEVIEKYIEVDNTDYSLQKEIDKLKNQYDLSERKSIKRKSA